MRARLAIIAGAIIVRTALAAPAFAEDMVRVGNPAGDDFHFSFANVGTEAGIFKKNGLELQIISLAGGAKLHAAMTAGSLDIALGAGTDFGLIVKGAPEKGVGALATKPSNIVIQGNTKNGITTIAALKGKKVAVSSVGALTYWMAQKLSQHEGWGLNGVEIVATGGGQANVAGFETGQPRCRRHLARSGASRRAGRQGQDPSLLRRYRRSLHRACHLRDQRHDRAASRHDPTLPQGLVRNRRLRPDA